MRFTLGLLAILTFACAPLSAWAQNAGPAPADEYFGPHHQSILEIRNRLDRLDRRSDREMYDSTVLTEIDDIDESVVDWQHQYPADPWLPHTFARLMRSYHRAGAASSPKAVAALDLMRHAYPDSDETSSAVAMVYGGVDLPSAPVTTVSNAWARFDAMRSTTTTAAGGP
jgi:hypothetical protein